MQNLLSLLASFGLIIMATAVQSQVQFVEPGEEIYFSFPMEYWGDPYVQYSENGAEWNDLFMFNNAPIIAATETTGFYRLRMYDEPCDSSYFSNVVEIVICDLSANLVSNPTTGRIWMDRNLGASQVATSPTDTAAYGGYYQWGRATTDFTPAPDFPFDWSVPQNDNLWQGVNGIYNPCPAGFRIPTEAEWNEERLSWGSDNTAGAFGSPLKLTAAGNRYLGDGAFYGVGSGGFYWSSSVSGIHARRLYFGSSSDGMGSHNRANGNSVRCIKD